MAAFEIRILSPEERQALAPARARQWRGALTVEQFEKRNRILYGGDFAQKRIRSYGLFAQGPLAAASCDFVEGACYTGAGKQQTHVLASVLTLPEFQKRGFASLLLKRAFLEVPATGYLYSDIGPEFYRRFGFVEDSWEEVIENLPHESFSSSTWTSISKNDFVTAIDKHRQQRVTSGACDVAFIPDADWIHWVEAKYAFYTLISRGGEARYGHVETPAGKQPVAMFADYLNKRVDVLWADPEHVGSWRPTAQSFAREHGLETLRYWGRGAGGKKTWPMFNAAPASPTPQSSKALRLDLNLGDWW